jgi:hypothetical protein
VTRVAGVAGVMALAAGTTAVTLTAGAAESPKATILATSSKKGVSTWEFSGVAPAIKDVGASWYYNWSPSNDSMPADAEFVPMIWGAADVTDAKLSKVKTEGKVLLGFNEPDMAGQANMSVEQALSLWPRLEQTGLRLGSPAVAYGGDTAGGWLDRFMAGAKAQNRRVDFITLHWYGSDFSDAAVGHFMGYVQAVYNRYQKPIWVTEYGLINFTGSPKYPSASQITAFITNSTSRMEQTSFVERYAWFSLPAVGDSVDYGLYRDGSTPTAAGVAYRAAGSGGGTAPRTGQITGMGGKCIGVAGGKTDDSTPIDVYSCVGDATQQWTIQGDGTIRNSGKCLDVRNSGVSDDTPVQIYRCNGTAAQKWVYSSGRDLVNPQANKCLEMKGNTSADFTTLQIRTCTGNANQKWSIP